MPFAHVSCFSPVQRRRRRPDGKDNSFTRSRSSSVTSIDRESREAISAFHFCESFPRKNDGQPGPCLLVGTTQGSVMMVALSLPPGGEQRLQQPLAVSSCGKSVRRLPPPPSWGVRCHRGDVEGRELDHSRPLASLKATPP